MNKQRKKLSLIIQTYRGNKYFKECLDSVKPNINFFEIIYISINQSAMYDADLETALSFKLQTKQLNFNTQVIIFTQNKTLKATEHSKIFYKNILKRDTSSDFFILLCHDDILLPTFSENILSILDDLSADTIINPARLHYKQLFIPKNYIGTYYGLLSYQELKTTKENFASKGFDCYPETNITGLIFSRKLLKEFCKVLPFFTYGYRFEYIMMFAPSIKYLKGTRIPIVGIRRHAEQTGSQFIQSAYEADEQLYKFYLWYTTKDRNFRQKVQKEISFFEKKLHLFLRILYLHFICFWLTKSVYCLLYTLCMIPITILYRTLTKLKKVLKQDNSE